MARVLVTGGTGFVGSALCRALKEAGHHVISVARREAVELSASGIEHFRLDLGRNKDRLIEISKGCDAIFHTAAKVDMWGDFCDFYQANVIATQNVVETCRRNRIGKLIFTSSPSVIADGRDLCGINETYPYPSRYLAYYPQTKAEAEKEVLSANSSELRTVSLRPHLIWGKGDTNLIPTILERAKAGRLVRVGDGTNLVDLTYIDDCVSAHICAFEVLDKSSEACGKAFFISQGDPVKLWAWINRILLIHDLPEIKRSIPKRLAMALAFVVEKGATLLPGIRQPLLTRFLVSEMATSHYFDISAARNILGYTPRHTISEAMEECFGSAA